tara:strand:- start:430 stop:762 length:333 start_codon:yes stop_codon:yes gene_type:complete
MKIFLFAVCLFFISCRSKSTPEVIIIDPPNHPVAVEINSVPPPFDMNGYYPYVVWVNGKRINLPKKDLLMFVDKFGKDNIPKVTAKDIHQGWLYPYFAENKEDLLTKDHE